MSVRILIITVINLLRLIILIHDFGNGAAIMPDYYFLGFDSGIFVIAETHFFNIR